MTTIKKILITGGHVTPALAVIDRIREKKLPIEIVFVGRKYVNETEKSESFEYKEVTSRKIRFIHLDAGRITRILSIRSLKNALRVPMGFNNAWNIMKKEKPDAVLSFGGYLALPVAYVAKMQKIPIFTHEQTVHPGLANRMIGRIADIVFVSFPESIRIFNSLKTICTGNPLRKSVFNNSKEFEIPKGLPVIYVTGGSLGAHAVNKHIEQILPKLLETCVVIHQTGNVKEYRDFERLRQFREMMKPDLKKRYIVREHVTDDEIGYIYSHSDVVVGRSGANTFFELIALGIPAVFIPLPWAAHDEQREHASVFKNQKAGEIFEQKEESEELYKKIMKIITNIREYKSHVKELSHYHKEDAADQIITCLTHR